MSITSRHCQPWNASERTLEVRYPPLVPFCHLSHKGRSGVQIACFKNRRGLKQAETKCIVRVPLDLCRIDDRLIHGQVVVGWGQPLDLEHIVLADDAVSESEWEQELYRAGVPPDMALTFCSVGDAAASMPALQADPRVTILLTADITSMRQLVVDSNAVPQVNLGGLHHRDGRVQKLRYVFLAPEEEEMLRSLAARGVAITAQDVPSASPVPLTELLAARSAT